VTGPGIFGLTDTSYNLFLRLMGAKIGRRAVVGRGLPSSTFQLNLSRF